MKRCNLILSILTITLIITSAGYAEYPWLKWSPESGVAVRQGWHLEWSGSSAYRAEGELAGEAGLVWTDTREGRRGVHLQVISSEGEPKFEEDGIGICLTSSWQEAPQILPASDGGWYISWLDYRDVVGGSVYLTKISEDGEVLWGAETQGLEISRPGYEDPEPAMPNPPVFYEPFIVETADDGCIIAWRDCRLEHGVDLFAKHILSDGSFDPDWPEEGVGIESAENFQWDHNFVSDGNGGGFALWTDSGEHNDNYLVLQRIAADGQLSWDGGLAVDGDSRVRSPNLCCDGQCGAFIVWEDNRNSAETGYDIYAQHVDAEGNILWDNGEAVCIAAGRQLSPDVILTEQGRALVTWEDTNNEDEGNDIYTMLITGDDELQKLWEPAAGVPVVREMGYQVNHRTCPDGAGGAYIAWIDYGVDDFISAGIQIQHYNRDGQPTIEENQVDISSGIYWENSLAINSLGDNLAMVLWLSNDESEFGIQSQAVNVVGEIYWEEGAESICEGITGYTMSPCIIPLDNQRFIVTWSDSRLWNIGATPYFQYYQANNDGIEPLFAQGGLPAFRLDENPGYSSSIYGSCTDGDGGCYIAFIYCEDNHMNRVLMQHINSDGELLWGNSGLHATSYEPEWGQENTRICPDGDGGVFVVFIEENGDAYQNIHAVRLDADGNNVWGDQVISVTNHNSDDHLLKLIPDGKGGAAVLYRFDSIDDHNTESIAISQFNGDGELLLGENGIIMNSTGEAWDADIALHDEGFMVFWNQYNNEETGYDVYCQLVEFDGNVRYRAEGASVCVFEGEQTNPRVIVDNAGYAWVLWSDTRFSAIERPRVTYIQKFETEADGDEPGFLFDIGGFPINPERNYQGYPNILADQDNGIWVIWNESIYNCRGTLHAIHLDADGMPYHEYWGSSGLPLCNAENTQGTFTTALLNQDGSDGFVVAWEDWRSRGYEEFPNIYCQRVDDDILSVRNLEAEAIPADFRIEAVYPNPFNSMTRVSYALVNPGIITLKLHDLSGRELFTTNLGEQSVGKHELLLDANTLPSGMYLLKLATERTTRSTKVVILK